MMLANHDQSCGFLRNRVMTGCDYIWKIASSSEKDVGLAGFHLISTILISNNSVLPLISRVVLSQTELGLAQFFQPATLCTVWMCVSSDVELSQIHLHKGGGGKCVLSLIGGRIKGLIMGFARLFVSHSHLQKLLSNVVFSRCLYCRITLRVLEVGRPSQQPEFGCVKYWKLLQAWWCCCYLPV